MDARDAIRLLTSICRLEPNFKFLTYSCSIYDGQSAVDERSNLQLAIHGMAPSHKPGTQGRRRSARLSKRAGNDSSVHAHQVHNHPKRKLTSSTLTWLRQVALTNPNASADLSNQQTASSFSCLLRYGTISISSYWSKKPNG